MKKYEYIIESVKPITVVDEMKYLNEKGNEGWRLIMIINSWYYFEREILK